jgi:hypothetical protein
VNTHPIVATQVSMVQTSLSLQQTADLIKFPVEVSQEYLLHLSSCSNCFMLYFGVLTHPLTGSQVSTVHAFPSVHEIGVFLHVPAETSQESVVHALLSSQDFHL